MGEDGPRSQTCGLSNKTFQIKTGILAKKRKPDGKYFTRVFFKKKSKYFCPVLSGPIFIGEGPRFSERTNAEQDANDDRRKLVRKFLNSREANFAHRGVRSLEGCPYQRYHNVPTVLGTMCPLEDSHLIG